MHGRRLERVWRALADSTRRRLVDLLSRGPATTGELAAAVPRLSRFAVMKHLRVLERAGLVLPRRQGRQVWNHLNAVPLREVYERWVGAPESVAAEALLRLKRRVEDASGESPAPWITPTANPPAAPRPEFEEARGDRCVVSLDLDAEVSTVWAWLSTPELTRSWDSCVLQTRQAVIGEACVIRTEAGVELPGRVVEAAPLRRLVVAADGTGDGAAASGGSKAHRGVRLEFSLASHGVATEVELRARSDPQGVPVSTRFVMECLLRLREAIPRRI